MKANDHFRSECPECSSRLKRLPATRRDKSHVYCMDCGHDFGRYAFLIERYRHELETLELRLNTPTNTQTASGQ
ncbi:MAG: hypothetical protein ACTIDY_08745 [Halomonadaceae bacterium]|uniref:Uncharacterized protein n=1 Tax=Halomonas colorata TaxID=2742615 RepID=A0ABR9FZA7_9GAMM|nr:hypothetical protein [Halomonas colorata]MBE0463967.1 hypothetical protein [Halomonas colorata]